MISDLVLEYLPHIWHTYAQNVFCTWKIKVTKWQCTMLREKFKPLSEEAKPSSIESSLDKLKALIRNVSAQPLENHHLNLQYCFIFYLFIFFCSKVPWCRRRHGGGLNIYIFFFLSFRQSPLAAPAAMAAGRDNKNA